MLGFILTTIVIFATMVCIYGFIAMKLFKIGKSVVTKSKNFINEPVQPMVNHKNIRKNARSHF